MDTTNPAVAPQAPTPLPDIRVEQVARLYRYVPVSIGANLLIGACVAYSVRDIVAASGLLTWLGLLMLGILIRAGGCIMVRRHPVDAGSVLRAETVFTIGACATGAAWGFSLPLLDIGAVAGNDHWFVKTIVLVSGAGIASGGAFVMAHRPWPPRLFLASILFPAFGYAAFFAGGGPREYIIAALVIIFFVFMVRSTSLTSAVILRGMLLHREAEASARAARASAQQRDIAFEELRSLSAAMPDLLLKFDREGRLLWANPSAEHILGDEYGKLGERRLAEFVGDGQADALETIWRQAQAPGPQRLELRLRTVAGERPYLLSLAPLRDGDGVMLAVVCIGQDISAMKRIAEQLEEARAAAERASDAKSRFLANMSHEIRTPLNAVIGLSELALREPLAPAVGDYLRHIRNSGSNLLAIVNDILDFSKIEAGKMEIEAAPFELGTVLELVRTQAGVLGAGKDLDIDIAGLPEALPPLQGDAVRLAQILTNLVGNAIKFTPRGRVELRTEIVEREDGRLRLAFHVRDTGIGMSPSQIARIFQAFTQADLSTTRRFGGTGLGLTISRRLADLMGGHLEVDSEPGKGSRFSVVLALPLAAPRDVATPTPAGTLTEDRNDGFAGRRALLAEDHPVNRLVAGNSLEQLGLSVDVAVDGRAAVELFSRPGNRYDVIFMDVQMPEMDGLEATRLIRACPGGAAIPIIAITANAFEQDRQDCLQAGMNDFLAKPFRPEDLAATLARWVGANAQGSPAG